MHYQKKVFIIASLFTTILYGQNDLELVNIIDLENHINPNYNVGIVFTLESEKAQKLNNVDLVWQENRNRYIKPIKIDNDKYSVTLLKELTLDLYFAKVIDSDGLLDSSKSFYYMIEKDSVVLYQEEQKRRESEAASPIYRYKKMGFNVVSSTSNGNTTIVTMKKGNSYVTLTLYKGKLRSTSRHSL